MHTNAHVVPANFLFQCCQQVYSDGLQRDLDFGCTDGRCSHKR